MMREWHWITDASDGDPLPDLSLFTDPGAGCTVKRNPFRSVRRVTAPDGAVFFVKHDVPRTAGRIFKEAVRPKALSEYRSGKLLRSAGIPCISFVALGRRFPESVLVSRELKGYVSSLEFRYTTSEEPLRRFLRALADMVRRMLEAKIVHPDFHAGNIMVRRDDPDVLCLLDPFGVRRSLRTPFRADCRVFCDFADRISPDEARELFSIMEADPVLWEELKARARERILREWPRRAKQILGGRSKFLRLETLGGNVYRIRNTPWFTEQPFSLENTVSEEMDPRQAEKIWLDSFRAAMLNEKQTRIPCAYRPCGERSFLYYDRADS
ncbi:MAG: phosphotransferase [Lentisphaeria bacterium]|nr:phosphotransferase [Lentisphaeria bacterium]